MDYVTSEYNNLILKGPKLTHKTSSLPVVSVETSSDKKPVTVPQKTPTPENDEESQFITVLSINNEDPSGEILTVSRALGEKLGFGLKFIGGNSGSNERIKKLFIQSCAPNRYIEISISF